MTYLVEATTAATALRLENERLRSELSASLAEVRACRARAIEATERAAKRIERNLHDGAQQRLVSLAMSLGLLDAKLPMEPDAAKPMVREAREALAETLGELRELSQGLYPGILVERGLAAALADLVGRAGLPACVEVSLDARPCPAAEAAAYFVVSEALTNAAKHSQAGAVRIAASRERDRLTVEVTDDGIGGAAVNGGSGIRGLMDRVEAMGGTLVLVSPRGGGTILKAKIPCSAPSTPTPEVSLLAAA